MHRHFLPLLVFALLLLSSSSRASQPDEFFPVGAIRPMMVGTIYCEFEKDAGIEAYSVLVRSVIGNRGRQGDGWRGVLIEAGDDLIEAHGGFASGMSGAPIYIDGRLAGAFYEHFEWTLENFGLMRPIDQMLKLWEGKQEIKPPERSIPIPEGERLSHGGREFAAVRLLRGNETEEYVASLIDVGTMPMRAASTEVVAFTGVLQEQGGGGEGATMEEFPSFTPQQVFIDPTRDAYHDMGPPAFRPGTMISVVQVIGDVNMWDVGCITYLDPDAGRFLAFGHDVFGALGDVNVPLGDCYAYHTFDAVDLSFILAVPTRIVGTVSTDAWQGVAGKLGAVPHMIRVELDLHDGDYGRDLTTLFHAADDGRIYPDAVPDAIQWALARGLDTEGRGYVTVYYNLATTAGDVYEFAQAYFSDNYAASAASDIATMLRALAENDFEECIPDSIEGEINLTKDEKLIVVHGLSHVINGEEKEGVPDKLSPGDEVEIKLHFEPRMAGGYDRAFKIDVPPDFPPGAAKFQVYGGLKRVPGKGEVPDNVFDEMKNAKDGLIDPLEPVMPEDLASLMESFRPDFRADEIVIQIVTVADEDCEGDIPHVEITERLDGIVTGVLLEEVVIEGGES